MGAAKIRKKNGTYPTFTRREPFIGTVGPLKHFFTESQWLESQAEETAGVVTALHESSHVVAAFLLGVTVRKMMFNNPKFPDLLATVESGIPLPEMLATSLEERWLHGVKHAFISLAGAFGCSGESLSENPFHKSQCDSHVFEAYGKLHHIGGVPKDELNAELARLRKAVNVTFDKPVVKEMVHRLAKEFSERRHLNGAEINSILQQVLEKGTSEESGRAA